MIPAPSRECSRATIWLFSAALAVVLMPGASSVVSSQTRTTLSGTLFDPHGGVVSGAQVLVKPADGKSRETRSDVEGTYRLSALPAGRHSITVKYPGLWTPPIEVDVSPDGLTHDIGLRAGGVTETVIVRRGQRRPASARASEAPALRPAPTCNATTPGGRPAGGTILPPIKVVHVPPVYPATHETAGIVGRAIVEGTVSVGGRATALRVAEATSPEFARSATDAIAAWRFDPFYLNCRPYPIALTVTVQFVR